ncbi:MAG: hypothetical protein JNL60_15125 [Bacteroidia bacterium]|nr:hypothetical protein [Bacteroidia bacterium]
MRKSTHLLLVPAIAVLTLAACKSKKETPAQPVQKDTGAVEISVPFSGKEYRSDENAFRSKQVGKSPDIATAKKIAYQNAKAEMAGNINSTIKRVTDQYTNQRTVGNTQEFENKFEELSREVVNMEMSNVKEIGEKIFKEPDGSYTYWIAIEADKKTIFDKVDAKISNDAKLKLDYDKKKFQEVFDAEMKKLAEEGK